MTEEAVIRMGLDASPIDKGLRTVGQKLTQFGDGVKEVAHKAHRDWHKALEAIKDESPALGLALKAALSPIGAALSAGVMLFTFVHSKLEEFNKDLDRQAEEAAKPIGNMREAVEKAEAELKKYRKEFQNWLQSHDHTVTAITDGLKQHIELLQHQKRVLDAIVEKAKERAILEGKDPKQLEAAAEKFKNYGNLRELMSEFDARRSAGEALRRNQQLASAEVSAAQRALSGFDMKHFLDRPELIKSLNEQLSKTKKELDDLEKSEGSYQMSEYGFPIKVKDFGGIEAKSKDVADLEDKLRDANRIQKSETDRLESIKNRLARGQTAFDSFGSQITANDDVLRSLGFKRDEMLAGMTPEQMKANIIKEAGAHALSEGQLAAQQFARDHDAKRYQNRLRDIRLEHSQTVRDVDKMVVEQTKSLDSIRKALTEGIITVQGAPDK
jgi:hypothetical protein